MQASLISSFETLSIYFKSHKLKRDKEPQYIDRGSLSL